MKKITKIISIALFSSIMLIGQPAIVHAQDAGTSATTGTGNNNNDNNDEGKWGLLGLLGLLGLIGLKRKDDDNRRNTTINR